jgi:hypothetical protein
MESALTSFLHVFCIPLTTPFTIRVKRNMTIKLFNGWLSNQRLMKSTKWRTAMKMKDLLTIITVALGTATLTVATFLADSLEAGSEANPPAATIAKPRLVAHGMEMTLAPADGRFFKTGDQPGFELRAVNTLNESSDATVHVTMTASAPVSPLSRVVLMPVVLWQEEWSLKLEPNETRVFTFTARTNLPANSVISVSLSEANSREQTMATGRGIVALSFSTVTPKEAANPANPVFFMK